MMIKRNETVSTDPMSTGISRKLSAFTISFPIPFQANIYSTKTAPAKRDPNQSETTVTTGFNAFRRVCLKTTINFESPLAIAVLT